MIRGEEHISNTPRQILIQEALGFARPQYAHYPLHLSADRSKLSKRKGDVSVKSYREKGFLPQALLNYIGHLGWTPPSGQEIMSLQQMVNEFEIKDLHKSGAVFDLVKLRWYNRQYLQGLSAENFHASIIGTFVSAIEGRGLTWDEEKASQLMPLLKERISVSSDIAEMAEASEFDFFFGEPQIEPSRIAEKKSNPETAITHLSHAREVLEDVESANWNEAATKNVLWDYAGENGRGAVLWPLRYSLSGQEKSPDPFAIMAVIGKERTLERIDTALSLLQNI